MGTEDYTSDTMLVIIKHPEKGDETNGKAICDEVRAKIAGSDSPICILHNAAAMQHANSGYAGEFKKLDKNTSSRVVEIIAAIPGSIPRMMAHTVAMFSDKSWTIFKEVDEAIKYLNTKGFNISAATMDSMDTVSVMKR